MLSIHGILRCILSRLFILPHSVRYPVFGILKYADNGIGVFAQWLKVHYVLSEDQHPCRIYNSSYGELNSFFWPRLVPAHTRHTLKQAHREIHN